MLKFLSKLARYLEGFEGAIPRIFWTLNCSLSIFLFHEEKVPILPIQISSQSEVVIQQVRAGGENLPFLAKRKKIDLAFHRRLEEEFPDWEERMDYQKKQANLYESAMRKAREAARTGVEQSFQYTAQELDAINYFEGTGFYAKYQDRETKPNIFDTRQSFLLKMHDPILRNNFLNSLNHRKN